MNGSLGHQISRTTDCTNASSFRGTLSEGFPHDGQELVLQHVILYFPSKRAIFSFAHMTRRGHLLAQEISSLWDMGGPAGPCSPSRT